MAKTIARGVAHSVPADMRKVIVGSEALQAAWDGITPLARNEWICWITSAKKSETRAGRIERMRVNLANGKRRPCCWQGCSHR